MNRPKPFKYARERWRPAGITLMPDMNSNNTFTSKGWHSRGYLPHLDSPEILQAITFRLSDSVPVEVLKLMRQDAAPPSVQRARVEAELDTGHGECLLNEPDIAAIIENALLHFDGVRYALLAWCIMPNHVHVLIELFANWPLYKVVAGWKSYSAKAINLALGRRGGVWQREYYDRYIRDDEHLQATIEYIENNPVKAGLVRESAQWSFSSASRRG